MTDPLRVGLLFPLSGMWGWVGELCVRGVEAALELAREGGARVPERVELLSADVAEGRDARREAERLADAGAHALAGTVFSAPALRATAVAHERGLFYLETVAAATEITTRGHPHLVRFNTTARAYGRAAGEIVARTCGPSRIAIVQLDDPFCASFASGAREVAAAARLDVVAHEVFASDGDVRATVRRAAGARPDVAILAGFSAALGELWSASRESLSGVRALVGNGAWAVRPIAGGRPVDLEGLFVVDTPHFDGLPAGAVSAHGRAQHAAWAARHSAPSAVDIPVDPDMAFIAASIFFERIVPAAASFTAGDFRAAAARVDLALGDTFVGYGAHFDTRGDNERAFPVVLQWQRGEKPVVHPEAVATASPRALASA